MRVFLWQWMRGVWVVFFAMGQYYTSVPGVFGIFVPVWLNDGMLDVVELGLRELDVDLVVFGHVVVCFKPVLPFVWGVMLNGLTFAGVWLRLVVLLRT